jgi:hypothetical protein
MGWRRGRPTAVAVSALEKLAILGVDMFSLSNPEISISADRYATDVVACIFPFGTSTRTMSAAWKPQTRLGYVRYPRGNT